MILMFFSYQENLQNRSKTRVSESQGLGGFWVESQSESDYEEHWESESEFLPYCDSGSPI